MPQIQKKIPRVNTVQKKEKKHAPLRWLYHDASFILAGYGWPRRKCPCIWRSTVLDNWLTLNLDFAEDFWCRHRYQLVNRLQRETTFLRYAAFDSLGPAKNPNLWWILRYHPFFRASPSIAPTLLVTRIGLITRSSTKLREHQASTVLVLDIDLRQFVVKYHHALIGLLR